MTENWRPVVGFEGTYEVSDLGRVRGVDRVVRQKNGRMQVVVGGIKSQRLTGNGYLSVRLSGGNRKAPYRVHLLVLEAFVGMRPSEHECRHIDGEPTNNQLSNLAWGSRAENTADRVDHVRTHGQKRLGWSNRTWLTDAQRAVIRQSDDPQRALALRYNVTQHEIARIRNGRIWRREP